MTCISNQDTIYRPKHKKLTSSEDSSDESGKEEFTSTGGLMLCDSKADELWLVLTALTSWSPPKQNDQFNQIIIFSFKYFLVSTKHKEHFLLNRITL